MDADGGGGVAEVLVVSNKSLLDVEFFELGDGFVEHNLAVEHFGNEGFHLFAQHIVQGVGGLIVSTDLVLR